MTTESKRLPGLTDAMKARLTALIDQDYSDERKSLHPAAEKLADQQCDRKSDKWGRIFMKEVDRLWWELNNNREEKNGTGKRYKIDR